MIQTAVGVAGLLIMLILAAGAACWTVALLKLVAASRLAPAPVAGLATQLLVALNITPREPLVRWSSRRAVPWALVDLIGILALYVVGILALRIVLEQLNWLPAISDETKLTLADKELLVWANMVASLGLLAVALPLIALRTGAAWRDFGFSVRDLGTDVKLGLAGFVMLAPPVYTIQIVLVYFWQPSKHPLIEMFKQSPDASFFAILFIAAAVIAPIFEELIFRVLLQGFLEKVFAFRGPAHELVFGSPSLATQVPPISTADELLSAAEITFLTSPADLEVNPYAASSIVGEQVVPAVLAVGNEQPTLCGPLAWLPIGISSIIFALMHYSHGPDWVPLILLATGMGFLYQRTHRVAPSLVVHALLNSLSMFGLWLSIYALPELGR
jgi:membrane protease YdiL (CAAX protease family)